MAHRAGQKEEAKQKILEGAGRGFRRAGFGGSGVDGLAKEAGVTSGAFYAHFKSKAEAFREVVFSGLEGLIRNVQTKRKELGAKWREAYIDFYLGERRTCDVSESCALQSLSIEVARADDEARATYEEQLKIIIASVADGLEGKPKHRREEAMTLLALLVGGVTLARAVKDPALSQEIAQAVRKTAIKVGVQQQ